MKNSFFSNVNSWLYRISEYKITLFIILFTGFILRVLFYLNTTQFENVSEAGSIFRGLARLKNGDYPYLFEYSYTMTLSYIAFFFVKIFGQLHWFFIFQCLLSTVTIYFVYLIVFQVANSKVSALLASILAVIYMDYLLLPSIAYNQTYEVFFTSASILLIFKILKCKLLWRYILNSTCLFLVIYISVLFRGTLKYLYFVLPIIAAYYLVKKGCDKWISLRLIITFVLFLVCFTFFSPRKYLSNPNEAQVANDFRFFGHTWYGGHGGEGSFVYEKNKNKYDLAFKEYLKDHNIEKPGRVDINNFQRAEIKKTILNKPGSWILLQIKKIVYTYSIIPVRDTLTILMTGRIKFGVILSALIAQVTFIIPLLMLLIFINRTNIREQIYNVNGMVLIIIFGYLIAATSLYGHYSERYRIVVMVCSLIPFASIFFNVSYIKTIFTNKRVLIWKVIALSTLFLLWLFQAFEAIVLHKERYFKALELMNT